MKKILVIIAALLSTFCYASPGLAYDVVVIKSLDIKPYNEALEGFKSITSARFEEFVISEQSGKEIIEKIIRRDPDLIFAVGMDALSRARTIKDVPIIYAMVSNPRTILSGEENITGISMNIPAKKQLGELLRVSKNIKTIGIVYDPKKTRHLFDEVLSAASSFGISVHSHEVNSHKEVPSAIKNMAGKIDVFWMLPDTTVLTEESIKYLLLFSFENNVPVFSFSKKYVDMGALLSLNIDTFDIGRQAGEMANRILSGEDVKNTAPRKAILYLNRRAMKKWNIVESDEIIRE